MSTPILPESPEPRHRRRFRMSWTRDQVQVRRLIVQVGRLEFGITFGIHLDAGWLWRGRKGGYSAGWSTWDRHIWRDSDE